MSPTPHKKKARATSGWSRYQESPVRNNAGAALITARSTTGNDLDIVVLVSWVKTPMITSAKKNRLQPIEFLIRKLNVIVDLTAERQYQSHGLSHVAS